VVVPNPECYSVSGVSVLAKNIYVERRCFHPIHQGQGGHLTKKGRRGKPSAKLGVARRMPKDAERVMTAPISNSARHRHLLARPVSSGGRGSDPTRPYPSHTIPSLAADSRAPLPPPPSPLVPSPSSLEPRPRILRKQFAQLHFYFLIRTPHTRLPAPDGLKRKQRALWRGDLIVVGSALFSEEYMHLCTDADAMRSTYSSQESFIPPFLKFLLSELAISVPCECSPHPKTQVLHV
jgi:hypothetical protein